MEEKPKDIKSFVKQQAPEPMDDPFLKKQSKVSQLDDKFNIREIQHIIQRVSQCLMTQALHMGRKSNKYNQTELGGVSFYIDHNEITKQTRLMFNKHPKTWNEKEIIKDANNIEADIMMEKQAQDNISDMDNPFTY